jgi:succinate dehydrogenase/fumarate reductase flavoprotein subunit
MNAPAIELYRSRGIDLYSELLEIDMCAQHNNGGFSVDVNYESSSVKNLFISGEAAGVFGIHRPGGSALNSTQVGSLRAAEYISKMGERSISFPTYTVPSLKYARSNIAKIKDSLQSEMSLVADFDRDTKGMKALFDKVNDIFENFFEVAKISDPSEISELFKLYDTVLTQRSVLSAMIYSAQTVGTHGSSLVNGCSEGNINYPKKDRTLTRGEISYSEKISPIPNPELWFETLLAQKMRQNNNKT